MIFLSHIYGVNEVAERLAFFAIAVNMVTYLVKEMNQTIPDAATHVTDWIGAAYVLTLLGAFLADAYLGRFKTIFIFSWVYTLGMVLLTLSASIDSLRPPKCIKRPCTPASDGQNGFLFVSLALIALGTGGIKPCVSSFGADQFDEGDPKEVQKKYAFFNWFFFAINMGAILGITVLVYLQQEKGWTWGFAVPTVAMFVSILVLVAGFRVYRYQKPMGSPFTRFVQVGVASVRNHFRGVEVGGDTELYEVRTDESGIHGAPKLAHTAQDRFLDKAAVISDPDEANTKNRWSLCTVTQVEEFKSFIRVLPVWASTIALSISFAQLSTFFITQASIMDRRLGSNFTIPPGSVPVFSAANALILVPLYENLIIPFLRRKTGLRRGVTSLQRMGAGLFISIFAMASAALVEKRRRSQGEPQNMSVFWLLPQFFLIGTAEVFTYVGQLEFFYNEATDGTRSISSAMFLSEIGIGSWISTALVKIVEGLTGGLEKGWLRNDLNQSKLDYFYWILTAINAVNFLVYVVVALRYKGRGGSGASVRDEAMVEMGSQGGLEGDI
ncbi:Peptide-transporting ATPase [Bertholletia excelsa]